MVGCHHCDLLTCQCMCGLSSDMWFFEIGSCSWRRSPHVCCIGVLGSGSYDEDNHPHTMLEEFESPTASPQLLRLSVNRCSGRLRLLLLEPSFEPKACIGEVIDPVGLPAALGKLQIFVGLSGRKQRECGSNLRLQPERTPSFVEVLRLGPAASKGSFGQPRPFQN